MESAWIRFYSPKADYFEFSNFYKHKIPLIIDGKRYVTVENYFQSQKYANDVGKNLEFMELIATQTTGAKAKMLANPIRKARWPWERELKELRELYEDHIHFDALDWEAKKDKIMLKALIAKFTQDHHCRNVLLSTENAILQEDTARDHYWGSGGDPKHVGRLGELLMLTRLTI